MSHDLAPPYGGSDRVTASFLTPRYVCFNSISKSRDFGFLADNVIDLEGLIGSQAGTNTLFFFAEVPADVKLGFCRIPGNPREDQHVALNVYDADSRLINYDHGTLGWNQGTFRTGVERITQTLDPYVEFNYWDPQGYTENDFGTIDIIQEVPAAPGIRILGEPVPAGRYRFTITTNQWQAIPYHCRIVVQAPTALLGVATGVGDTYGSYLLSLSRYVAYDYWLVDYAVDAEAPPSVLLAGSATGTGDPTLRLGSAPGLFGTLAGFNSATLSLAAAPPFTPPSPPSGVALQSGDVFLSLTLE